MSGEWMVKGEGVYSLRGWPNIIINSNLHNLYKMLEKLLKNIIPAILLLLFTCFWVQKYIPLCFTEFVNSLTFSIVDLFLFFCFFLTEFICLWLYFFEFHCCTSIWWRLSLSIIYILHLKPFVHWKQYKFWGEMETKWMHVSSV